MKDLSLVLKILLLINCCFFSLNVDATKLLSKENVRIHFSEISGDKLNIEYTLDSSVSQLYLKTTPDQSRAEFWKPESNEFVLSHVSGNDIIQRADGKSFKTATFVIDIVDISLPKYYRPFSPFFKRDDGLVIHTGQYFACSNLCDKTPTTWAIEITAKDANIVHYQDVGFSKVTWQDNGDGRSFYVGPQAPVESENLIAMIDSGLPEKLHTILNRELPNLVDVMAEKFETFKSKPLVFASYNIGDPARRGYQGGVLNKTVMLHWWGVNLEQRIDESDTLWFIIHEIAHFYQHQEFKVDVDEVAWIHEGFADIMAAELLADDGDKYKEYVHTRFEHAKSECAAGLKTTPLGKATDLKKFDLHYKCGLLLHRYISQSANQSVTVFDLWNRYRLAINQGLPASKETYLSVVEGLLEDDEFSVLETIVGNKIPPSDAVRLLMNGSTL